MVLHTKEPVINSLAIFSPVEVAIPPDVFGKLTALHIFGADLGDSTEISIYLIWAVLDSEKF